MIDNLSDDALLIIYRSILDFLNENNGVTQRSARLSFLPTPKQKEMDIVLRKYNLEMVPLTEYLHINYDNSGVPFYDKNGSAKTYFDLRSRELYSGLIGLIREKRINAVYEE